MCSLFSNPIDCLRIIALWVLQWYSNQECKTCVLPCSVSITKIIIYNKERDVRREEVVFRVIDARGKSLRCGLHTSFS